MFLENTRKMVSFFRLNIIRTVNDSFFDLWAEAQQPCTAIALPPTLTYTPSYQRKIFSIQSAHVLRLKKKSKLLQNKLKNTIEAHSTTLYEDHQLTEGRVSYCAL